MADVDLNLVRVFVAVYETGSVSAAAARLNVTQPSVSHALACATCCAARSLRAAGRA